MVFVFTRALRLIKLPAILFCLLLLPLVLVEVEVPAELPHLFDQNVLHCHSRFKAEAIRCDHLISLLNVVLNMVAANAGESCCKEFLRCNYYLCPLAFVIQPHVVFFVQVLDFICPAVVFLHQNFLETWIPHVCGFGVFPLLSLTSYTLVSWCALWLADLYHFCCWLLYSLTFFARRRCLPEVFKNGCQFSGLDTMTHNIYTKRNWAQGPVLFFLIFCLREPYFLLWLATVLPCHLILLKSHV